MLTESKVQALRPKEKEYIVSDDTRERGTGRLVMRVRPHGAKEWQYRYREHGKRKKLTLGTHPDLTLSQARQRAATEAERLTGAAVRGNGPGAMRKSLAAQPPAPVYGTLGELCLAYTEDMEWRGLRTHQEVRKRLARYVETPFPHLWKRQARDITAEDVRDILAHHIQRGVTTSTNRARAYLHAAYNYGLTSENDPLKVSSVKWGLVMNPVSHVPKQAQWERQGENVLADEDVRKAWQVLPKMRTREANAVPVVLLCFATAGQRVTSLLRLTVDDIHIRRKLIDMPPSGTKNKRPHVVPITDTAIAVLEPLIARAKARGHDYIFPNHRDPDEHMLLESPSSLVGDYIKLHKAKHWTLRDIRRTAKTVMGELGVSKEMRDRLHGHALQDVSSKHYDRYDYLKEKREAMAIWETWLIGVLQGKDLRSESH
nr:Putative prophage CPS-53 integrase [Virgibacillus halodenitrificans]